MSSKHLSLLGESAHASRTPYSSVWFEGTWHRSDALFERQRRIAGGLQALGVAPGDRVAVYMANAPEVALTYHALWRCGAAITPVVFLVPPPALRDILIDAGAVAVVTTAEMLDNVRAATSGVASIKAVVCLGGGDGVVDFADLEAADPIDVVAGGDDDLAALLFTGGTTGRAKGVMLSHANLWECGRASHDATYEPGLTRTLLPLPLSHAYGLIVSVVGLHHREPPETVLMRWFDPAGWIQLVEEHGAQRAPLVPAMLQALLGEPLEQRDLSSLRHVVSGSAPLSVEVAHEFERRVPGCTVLEGYGCTESGAAISVNRPGARRLGSVGQPLPGYEVAIRDDRDRDVPTGDIGEVCARSAGVMLGYWQAPDDTAEALRDGWLHTGDLGRLDDGGYLWIADRKKDLIIRGGFNVFPRDVEDVLLQHPGVASAGVIGRPDERLGEEVVAFVALRPGAEATPEELGAFVRERVGALKYPREVRMVAAVPVTPVGKVDRKALRALL